MMSGETKVYPLSASAYRRRCVALLRHLGVTNITSTHKLTPGCLRGSGATHYYYLYEELGRIQWKGRWRRLQTLEYYIQEVAGRTIMHGLSNSSKDLIQLFANALEQLIELKVSS